jgi:hypothetical protein
MNTFTQKLYNSVEFKTVFQLKLMCKELGIRRYSGKRKLWIQNRIKKHLNQKQEKEMKKVKGLFCYPEIIQVIYQYHTVDDVDLKRKNLLKNSHKEYLKTKKLIEDYGHLKTRPRRVEIKKHNFRNWYDLLDQNEAFYVLARQDFDKMLKKHLKLWLKTLGYKPKGGLSKLRKGQLLSLLRKHNEELSLI